MDRRACIASIVVAIALAACNATASPSPTASPAATAESESPAASTEASPATSPSVAANPSEAASVEPSESAAASGPSGSPAVSAPIAFGDGIFQVPGQVKPGTYRTIAPMHGCLWERLSGFTGAEDEVLASSYSNFPVVVTVRSTDKGFESLGCGSWTADLSAVKNGGTSFADGVYIVGTDIQPGTYHNDGSPTCFYERLSGFSGDKTDVLATGYPEHAADITIAKTDKGFKTKGCGTWTKA